MKRLKGGLPRVRCQGNKNGKICIRLPDSKAAPRLLCDLRALEAWGVGWGEVRGLGLQGVLVTGMNLVHTGLLQSFKLGICVWYRSDTGVPPKFRIAFGIRSGTYPGASPCSGKRSWYQPRGTS